MPNPYKLKEEIRAFIIEQKQKEGRFSCRKLVPLIQEHFQINISKSSINAIIKENNLSNKVGRPRTRPPAKIGRVISGLLDVGNEHKNAVSSEHNEINKVRNNVPEPCFESQPEAITVKPQETPVAPVQPAVPLASFPDAPEKPLELAQPEQNPVEPIPQVQVEKPVESVKTEEKALNPTDTANSPAKSLEAVEPQEAVNLEKDNGVSSQNNGVLDQSMEDFSKLVESKRLISILSTRTEIEYVVNCGCYLLRAADYKNSFSSYLSEKILTLIPDLKKEVLGILLESLIYKPIFKENSDLWRFLGKEVQDEQLEDFCKYLASMDLSSIRQDLLAAGIHEQKSNNFNNLCEGSLRRLNSMVQELFFPTVYQFLDFPTMYSRFYCLSGKVEKKPGFLAIRLFYPVNFKWSNDIVWQEDFLNTANKINDERIVTPDGDRIWFDASIGSVK